MANPNDANGKLLAMLGAWGGFTVLPLTILLSSLLFYPLVGLLFGLLLYAVNGLLADAVDQFVGVFGGVVVAFSVGKHRGSMGR